METFLYVVHIFACIALIPVILLQSGKGGGVSAAFGGGGSSTVFGARGASTFLTRMTTACAIIFMCTSLALAYYSSRSSQSVVGDVPAAEGSTAPAGGAAAPADEDKGTE